MTPSISRERLVHLLEAAQGKRIAVVGDAMLDVYLSGDVDRISPEAPVPVVRVRERKHALGGAANVAQNVLAIGARCDLVATVGNDEAGRMLRETLHAVAGGSASLVTERVLEAVREAVAHADAVVLEDYNKGVLVPAVIRAAIDSATTRKLPIVVDPKFKNFFAYHGATVFKPNRRELESALGAAVDVDHPDAVPATLQRLGVGHILLTLGDRGMALFSGDGEVARVPTVAREVYDVVGAGDTVTAYLASMLAAGATILEAAIIANIAAGIEVSKLGAVSVAASEVLEFAERFADSL